MRIAIVGSFSTGKTTLAEAAAAKLELPLLPEAAREVLALGFKLDKDATPETEAFIFLKQYYNEMVHPSFIGDRSLIDVMTYAGWVLDNQQWRKEMALWEQCLAIAKHHLRSQYTHVFYLPIEFPIVADGVRPLDDAFQKEIDERMISIMRDNSIEHQTLHGSVDERLTGLVSSVSR